MVINVEPLVQFFEKKNQNSEEFYSEENISVQHFFHHFTVATVVNVSLY